MTIPKNQQMAAVQARDTMHPQMDLCALFHRGVAWANEQEALRWDRVAKNEANSPAPNSYIIDQARKNAARLRAPSE